jgi:hypothetical protein
LDAPKEDKIETKPIDENEASKNDEAEKPAEEAEDS